MSLSAAINPPIDANDLLKVDIEGAEWDLFDSLSDEDFAKIGQITVEFHDFVFPSMRERSEKIIKRLKDMGFSFISKEKHWHHGTPYGDCLFYRE